MIKKYELTEERICKLEFSSENTLDIDDLRKRGVVSGEIMMHSLLQQEAIEKDICVLHLHPTYTVAAMYVEFELSTITKDFPEICRYTKVEGNVGPHPALSDDLAIETKQNIANKDIVGQENHRTTAIAPTPWAAFEHLERLEHICKIFLASAAKSKSSTP